MGVGGRCPRTRGEGVGQGTQGTGHQVEQGRKVAEADQAPAEVGRVVVRQGLAGVRPPEVHLPRGVLWGRRKGFGSPQTHARHLRSRLVSSEKFCVQKYVLFLLLKLKKIINKYMKIKCVFVTEK